MATGYTKPGVYVQNITRPSSITLLSTFRRPVIIGIGSATKSVTFEAVIRSSTGNFDNLIFTSSGIVSIDAIGKQSGLTSYVSGTDYTLTGNQVNWIGATKPVSGATYFVSYTYTRPSSDYIYKEWTDYGAFIDDMGSPSSANLISLLTFVGVKQNLSPAWSTVQVPSPGTYTLFTNAIDLTKNRDIQDMIILSIDPTVWSYAKQHVDERSLPQNKRRRIVWLGAAQGTLPGDMNTVGTIAGYAATLKDKRAIFVSPPRAQVTYNDNVTQLAVTVSVDGSFIAGALAMLRSTIFDPAAPLLRKTINGIQFYDEDTDIYFDDSYLGNMDNMGAAGVTVLYPVLGIATVRDDLTTDQSDVTTKDINIITAADYVDTNMESMMDTRFIGQKIVDQTKYVTDVKNFVIKILRLFQKDEIISDFNIADIAASIDPNAPTNVLVNWSWVPIFTNKIIFGSYVLKTTNA